jgi:hypothetical protein
MLDAQLPGQLGGLVGRAIIDDQPFDGVEARHRAWKFPQRDGQGAGLVEARDLNDELHAILGWRACGLGTARLSPESTGQAPAATVKLTAPDCKRACR